MWKSKKIFIMYIVFCQFNSCVWMFDSNTAYVKPACWGNTLQQYTVTLGLTKLKAIFTFFICSAFFLSHIFSSFILCFPLGHRSLPHPAAETQMSGVVLCCLSVRQPALVCLGFSPVIILSMSF